METNALDCYPVEWSGERDGTAEVYALILAWMNVQMMVAWDEIENMEGKDSNLNFRLVP